MTIISTTSVLIAALLGCSLAHRPQEQHLETSWNYSNIVFRIPKNYGVNVPIFSIQVLRFQKFLHLVNETESLCGQNKTTRKILEKRDTQQESRRENKRRRLESKNRVNVMPSLERTERGNERNRDVERVGGGKQKFKGGIGPLEYKGGGGGSFRSRSRKKHHPFHDGELFELSGRNRNLFAVSFDRETGMASLYFKKNLKDSDYMTITHQGSYVEVDVNGRTFPDTKGHECAKNYRHLYNVKLNIIESFNCKSAQESMCLLPESKKIRLQQWENEPEGSLLVLPSLEALCPNVERKIMISMNDIDDGVVPELEYISSITTTMPLDREFRDDSLGFTISCSIEGDSETASKKNMEGILVIKDVDDSPPIRIKSQKVVWKISQDVEALDDLMMVVDPDIEAKNDYGIELRGNHLGFIHVDTSQHHFPSVNKGYCATLTKNFSRPLSAACTVLTPHITFNNQYVHQYPEEEVNFSLVFIDKSLESSHQSNEVQYDLTLTLDHLKGSILYPVDSMLPPMYEMEFAPETNISLPRPLRKFTRITQMLHPTSHTEYDRLEKGKHTFSLASQFHKFGVELTPTLGILYISHPDELTQELEKGQVEIIINRGSNSSSVFIEFSENYNSCKNKPTNPPLIRTNGSSCGRHKYKNVCEESCSFGSLAVRCSWRENNGTWITPHFATCTPDLFTCPDGICDELEQIVYEICPQDCVEENNIKQSQNLELNPKRRGYPKRGISKGLGTCSCDDYCQCFPEVSEPARVPYLKKGTISNKGLEGESCGAACQVGLSLGILLAIFLLVIMFCRKRKDCSGKYKDGEMGRSPFPSDYAEDHSSSYGPPHGEAHAVALHSVHNFHHNSPRPNFNNNNIQDLLADFPLESVSIDRKWEFPRNQLIIEQTLGEGEFGKVTKARANGIGGQPGYTTVAVKMLKSNSTAAELADLLSEYDLLKEVSHPNVVRLLGACTTKGGPLYLIIEYCRYGSLRSYLRRSRHFELESRVGSVEESPGDYQVTPKELLSFAWQICKGMNYLGNMKLVHRDLAARNVLLAEGKTCKISDFGLTRDVYEGDLYFKRSKSRVPVKWMAIESLVDHVYTSKSDIWGFGVLLWELVNLGSSPYPGVTPERLFTLLQSGYRMEKPENCSTELYQVMRSCWNEHPKRRPTFSELIQTFERMIEANVEYLELRSLIVTNREYFDDAADVSDCQPNFLPPVQVKESSPASIAKQSTHSNEDFDVDDTAMDKDSYLVARSTLTVSPPVSQTSLEQFPSTVIPQETHMSYHGTHMHAHNPAYSPSSDDLPPILQLIQPPLLQYSSLANGPDEEEDVGAVIEEGQDSCRSEADSDSGRATGDSGYITEEGRKSVASKNASSHPQSFGKPLSSSRGSRGSYSPLTPLEMEGEQEDTFEDFEERSELIPEEMLNTVSILTPSPSINSRISPPFIAEKGSITSPTAISSSSSPTSSGTSADGLFSNHSQSQLQQRSRRNPVQV